LAHGGTKKTYDRETGQVLARLVHGTLRHARRGPELISADVVEIEDNPVPERAGPNPASAVKGAAARKGRATVGFAVGGASSTPIVDAALVSLRHPPYRHAVHRPVIACWAGRSKRPKGKTDQCPRHLTRSCKTPEIRILIAGSFPGARHRSRGFYPRSGRPLRPQVGYSRPWVVGREARKSHKPGLWVMDIFRAPALCAGRSPE